MGNLFYLLSRGLSPDIHQHRDAMSQTIAECSSDKEATSVHKSACSCALIWRIDCVHQNYSAHDRCRCVDRAITSSGSAANWIGLTRSSEDYFAPVVRGCMCVIKL